MVRLGQGGPHERLVAEAQGLPGRSKGLVGHTGRRVHRFQRGVEVGAQGDGGVPEVVLTHSPHAPVALVRVKTTWCHAPLL